MSDARLATDLLINAIALAAVIAALAALAGPRRGGSAVAARLATLYRGLALLLAARLAAWPMPDTIAAVPLMMVAAWLPLLALWLAEHLVRRHARRPVKWLALGGAIGFSVAALLIGPFWGTGVLIALALFQAVATAAAILLLVRRESGDLAPAEAREADVFALALLLAIPLAASDFAAIMPGLPVRGGAFAILLLVLATSRFANGAGSVAMLLADCTLVLAGGGLVAAGATLLLPDAPGEAVVRLAAIGSATAALVLIAQRLGEARLLARARPSLIAAIARLPEPADTERLIAAHPLLASGRLIEGAALAAYGGAAARMAERRVTTHRSAPPGETGDAARDLLAAQAASHLMRLSRDPPRFLAIAAGGAGGGEALADELDIVARLAARA